MMARASSGLLIPQPAAAPAIGDALEGGYYMGAAWDTVTYSDATYNFASLSVGQTRLFPVASSTFYDPLPFYAGQLVRIAPRTNTSQVFIDGTVTARSESGLSITVTAITGSTGSYSDWVIAARWKVILAPKSGGESTVGMAYKTETTAAPAECITLTNGRAATAAMVAANTAAGSVIYPAADFVRGVNSAALSGYADWEIPARDWLELAWRNLKPVTLDNFLATRPKVNSYIRDANTDDIANEGRGLNRHSVPPGAGYTALDPAQTPLAAFRAGGAQAMATEVYFWSSSEYSAAAAWYQFYFTSYPGSQNGINKTNGLRVRAVRREIL